MIRNLITPMVCLLVISIASITSAATTDWNGGSGNWADPTWSPAVPDANTDTYIRNGGTITIDGVAQAQSMYLGGPQQLIPDPNWVNPDPNDPNNVQPNIDITNTGTAYLLPGGNLSIGSAVPATGSLNVGTTKDGAFYQSGGSLVINNTTAGHVNVGSAASNGTFSQSNGYASIKNLLMSVPNGGTSQILVSGGTLNAAQISVGTGLATGNAYMKISDGAYINVGPGNFGVGAGGSSLGTDGPIALLEQTGGTLMVSSSDEFIIGQYRAATFNMSGGLLVANKNVRVGNYSYGGTSRFNMSGGSVVTTQINFTTSNVANTNGRLDLSGGTIRTRDFGSGSLPSALPVTLNLTGGVLAFNTVRAGIPLVTNNGTTIQPGKFDGVWAATLVGIGGYTQNSGRLEIDIASLTSFDKLSLTNAAAAVNLLGGDIVINLLGGYTPTAGDTFAIVTSSKTAAVSGVTTDPAWSVAAVGNNVVLTYIPEPATMSLLTLGGLALLRRKRA